MMSVLRAVKAAQSLLNDALNHKEIQAAEKFREATAELPRACAFDGLHTRSLSIASSRFSDCAPVLNLVLPQFNQASVFAGIRTAVEFGLRLASAHGMGVRIIALTGSVRRRDALSLLRYLKEEFGQLACSVKLIVASVDLPETVIGDEDFWVVTHWTTAHAVDVAHRLGLVRPDRVVYLVQDYEPGFSAWSSEFALARSTYHAGFHMVVNSLPLANYLRGNEGVDIGDDLVFRPQLDMPRIERAARARAQRPESTPSVLFYARPHKPRNLYSIGMSALALTLIKRGAEPLGIRTAGEGHPKPRRGFLAEIDILGRLSWDRYFDVLAESTVVLSLQYSPHPSHPPLDAVASGGWAVTNELGDTRGALHPHLLACEPDPDALSDGLLRALERARDAPPEADVASAWIELLGAELPTVLRAVSSRLGD